MILCDYQLSEEIAIPLEEYERDTNSSPAILVENLLRKFLYDKGYISGEEDVVKTPEEIYNERKSKFHIIHKKSPDGSWKLGYGDLDFGYFKPTEIDEVTEKFLDFSDEELEEMDMGKWKYDKSKYKPFIRAKLNAPLLTPEEFFNKSRLRIGTHSKGNGEVMCFYYKRKTLAYFNMNNYSEEEVMEIYDKVDKLSNEDIEKIMSEKQSSKLVSAEFLKEYLQNRNSVHKHLKYCVPQKSGNMSIVKRGHNFGTHSMDKYEEVWDFLNAHNWDIRFSTKSVGLKGLEYNGWLYLQMENIGDD